MVMFQTKPIQMHWSSYEFNRCKPFWLVQGEQGPSVVGE